MARTLIFSDPHLGVSRKANTTRASSQRLKHRVFEQTLRLVNGITPGTTVICCGDLFDKFSNDEKTLAQGIQVADRCHYILAGNHDSQKDLHKYSSFDLLLDEIYPSMAETALISMEMRTHVSDPYTFVPHALTQSRFEDILDSLNPNPNYPHNYLFLHCSWDRETDQESAGEEAALNLSRRKAQELLAKGFTRIFLGHEHKPTEALGGRVIVVGNPFPTSFGDLSEKRIIMLDPETDIMESITLYSEDYLHYKGPVSAALNRIAPFMDVVDDLGTEETAGIVRELLENKEVYAVRVHSTEEEIEMETIDRENIESLPEVVRKMVERDKPHLLELYDELVQSRGVQS